MTHVFVAPPQPSRKAKELSKAVAQLIVEYQEREGSMSRSEIQMARGLARQELAKRQGGGSTPVGVMLAIILGILLVGIALALTFALR